MASSTAVDFGGKGMDCCCKENEERMMDKATTTADVVERGNTWATTAPTAHPILNVERRQEMHFYQYYK
jgi:hypothetical protein